MNEVVPLLSTTNQALAYDSTRMGSGLCCVIPHFYIWVCHTCNVCRLTPIHMPLTQIVDSRFESRVIYAYIEYSTRNLWFPDSNFVSGLSLEHLSV